MFCAESAALGILPTSVKYRSDKRQAFSDTPVLRFSVRDHWRQKSQGELGAPSLPTGDRPSWL